MQEAWVQSFVWELRSHICCCSVAKLCLTLCDPMNYSMPGSLVFHYFLKFARTHVHWVSDAIQPSQLPIPSPALKFSSIKVFSNVLALGVRWSLSFCISPANQYSGLISFRIDWFDLLTVQGALNSLLNHHISKASILRHSAFIVQLSHPYMTTGKTITLTVWTFVGKVMFLLFNTLSRFVIAFLPTNKCLLISWLQSPSSVILEPKKTKPAHLFFLIYLPCHDGTRCHDLSVLNTEL